MFPLKDQNNVVFLGGNCFFSTLSIFQQSLVAYCSVKGIQKIYLPSFRHFFLSERKTWDIYLMETDKVFQIIFSTISTVRK